MERMANGLAAILLLQNNIIPLTTLRQPGIYSFKTVTGICLAIPSQGQRARPNQNYMDRTTSH